MSEPWQYISLQEAAKQLGLDESTTRRWCREGKLAAVKANGRWNVRKGAVQRLQAALAGPLPPAPTQLPIPAAVGQDGNQLLSRTTATSPPGSVTIS